MREKIKVLDCTLRDGGYYNDWNFSENLIIEYLSACSKAGVDMIELGLRSFESKTFKGATAFTSESFLRNLALPEGPQYGVMIDAKTIIKKPDHIQDPIGYLFPRKEKSKIDFVRVAAHYHEIGEAIEICQELKALGYIVALNLMQSVGKPDAEIEAATAKANTANAIDILYYADSLGNMEKAEQVRIIKAIRKHWGGDIGIHAHDNTQQALANTLHALELGVSHLDATITGMGRGAGNTKTEILLIELEKRKFKNYFPEKLHQIVLEHFEPMQKEYSWGTNLLYHLAAQNNIHPTYIQQLYSDPRVNKNDRAKAISFLSNVESSSYDWNTLEQALKIQEKSSIENKNTGENIREIFKGKEILIIGAGDSIHQHQRAIRNYIEEKKPTVLSVNINETIPEACVDHYAISHNIKYLSESEKYSAYCKKIIAPHSRFKEIFVKSSLNYELKLGDEWQIESDHCVIPFDYTMAYALCVCLAGSAKKISLVGFDGYPLLDERNKIAQKILDYFKNIIEIKCLTPTNYNIDCGSIYAL